MTRGTYAPPRSNALAHRRDLGRHADPRLERHLGLGQAADIDTLLDVMIVLSSFVFAIVLVMLGYYVITFQAKPGDESDGKPVRPTA